MVKILNISLEDGLYQQVVDKANDEDRSVRKMVAILVQRGLNPSAPIAPTPAPAPAFIPVDQTPLPVFPPNVTPKAAPSVSQPVKEEKTDKYWYRSDPEYIELTRQVKEIDEQIESGDLDDNDMDLCIKERQSIVSRINEIRFSKPTL